MSEFNLSLDRESYLPGETVKGILSFTGGKGINLKDFSLFVFGIETTKIQDTGYHTGGAATPSSSSQNVFFKQDLSPFATVVGATISSDRTLKALAGLNQIPFEFLLPEDGPPSYYGKYAWITYEIRVNGKRRWKPDIDKKSTFQVLSKRLNVSTNKVLVEKKNDEGIYMKIGLEKNTFSPGETLYGELTVNNSIEDRIRRIELTIISSEYAVGQSNNPFRFSQRMKRVEATTPLYKHSINLEWKKEGTIPFQMDLPFGLERSYTSKFSKYFWLLNAKLEIARMKDFHIETEIQII